MRVHPLWTTCGHGDPAGWGRAGGVHAIPCTGCGPRKVRPAVYDADSATDIRTGRPGHRRPRAVRLRHPHDREILRLALPAFGALVAEPLFLLADSAIVGHLGTPQLAGLGIAGAVLATAVSLCVFLAYGTTASVARRVGAGDLRAAIAQGVDGVWLAAGLGAVLAVVGLLAAVPLVEAFDPSAATAGYATTYLRVSAHRPAGDARRPRRDRRPARPAGHPHAAGRRRRPARWSTWCSTWLLVYGADMGVAGSALGTVLTQVGMAAAFLVVVVRGARAHGSPLRPDLPGIRAAARAGVPLVVRTATLRAALLVTTYVAASTGTVAVAAHQVAFTIWLFLSLALDAVAIAGQAIVGRYLGAGDAAGARSATRRMVEWGVAAGVLLGVVVIVLRARLRAALHPRRGRARPAVGGAGGRGALPAGLRGGVRARRGADRGR